jgi:uncharacterized membrane protein YdbT with pleckstrin-like domain
MNIINEKTHSIQGIWLAKNFVYMVFMATIFLAFFAYAERARDKSAVLLFGLIASGIIVSFAALVLRKIYFQYEFGEKNIILKQGIISKSQRQSFYGRIQNITLSQDFIDKCLNLASLRIETSSDGGGVAIVSRDKDKKKMDWLMGFMIGFMSNSIFVPGLLYKDASELKTFIMEQMKRNPVDDAQSGL